MSRHNRTKIAVVGGLGAIAGADILSRVVNAAPVKSGRDMLDICYMQHPFEDESGDAENDYDPTHRKFYVYDMVKKMEADGREVALLPCFISSTFLAEIAPETRLRLPDIVEALRDHLLVHQKPISCVGVLTSDYVRNSGHFEKTLGDDFEVIYPGSSNQICLMNAVYGTSGIKTGSGCSSSLDVIVEACHDLIVRGAELIVPGFTEIAMQQIALQNRVSAPIADCNQIFADFALKQICDSGPEPFKLGIVGGIGPAATVDFMNKVIGLTDSKCDQDHIKMVVDHNPQIPDRTKNLVGEGSDPTMALYACCKRLEARGARLIVMPCNTAHAYVDRLQKYLSVPIVNMLQSTVDYIRQAHPKVCKVGVLATNGTLKSKLYQDVLCENELMPLQPEIPVQKEVMDAIYGKRGVKAGITIGLCVQQLSEAIAHLKEMGAEAIILGCTELPLIASVLQVSEKPILIDPTKILALKCVQIAKSWSDE